MIHDDKMRPYAVASVVLHVAAIALLVLGMPPIDREMDLPGSVSVDIVAIGPETGPARVDKGTPNAQPAKLPDVKPAPPAPPPPPPAKEQTDDQPVTAPEPPKLAQTPPPPREVQPPPKPTPPPPPPPDPEPAPAPKPKPPEPKPEPPKPEPPKPEPPKPEPPKAEPPKPEPPKKTETAKTEPKKPEKDQLSSLLDNVLKDAPKSPATSPSTAPSNSNSKQASASAPSTVTGKPGAEKAIDGPSRAFTPSRGSADAVKAAVVKKWNVDPGILNTGNLAVTVLIELAPDFTVTGVGIDPKDYERYRNDRVFRAVADGAMRAIRMASPLPLSRDEFTPEHYKDRGNVPGWHQQVYVFDPKDTL